MLNSILKFAIFIAIVGALAFAAHFLLTAPDTDGVAITFSPLDIQVQITPFIAVAAVIIGYVALYFLLKVTGIFVGLFNFIIGNDSSFTRWFQRADERRGAEALAQAHAALATGDVRKARQKALVAERKLKRPELTRLINAQAAEMAGDNAKAKGYYKALADSAESALVGVKGLLKIADGEGDRETALLLAKTASTLRTDDKDILDQLYTLQSHKYDWDGARSTLGQMKRANLISAADAKRRESMLALAQAAEHEDAGRTGEALKMAVDAAKIDPTNVDALTKATNHLIETGATKQAARLVAEAWKTDPGPKIAKVFAGLVPDETPDQRRRRFEELFNVNPNHAQTLYTRAELALMQKKWDDAREALKKLNETEPSGRYCAIRAAIARGEGKAETEVRTWLVRGIGAPGAAEGMVTDPTLLPLLIGVHETAAMNGATQPAATKVPGTALVAAEEKAKAAAEKKPATAS
ncbi:MAG: heme biosynthesis HemY N-terminal domain-containing protein [Pseudomonadota bacterium]